MLTPFEETAPFEIYGFSTGNYTVDINDGRVHLF